MRATVRREGVDLGTKLGAGTVLVFADAGTGMTASPIYDGESAGDEFGVALH